MNHLAYRTTELAIKTIAGLTRARLNTHGTESIPKGPTIFVVNHFTRIETFLLPYHLHRLTGTPVWALAAPELFVGKFGRYLEQLGAVSTQLPDRDRLMVKTLLTAEACWIVFPEGRMVKNKKIMEESLKRRVFLASQINTDSLNVYFHNSFDKDQVHLLTDDRYNKFSEFVDFAMEKEVVASDGPVLEKDATRLATIFDFHRSRIDNPIAVIANEVEPLTRLQRRISRLCWQPGFWLKRKVARYLMKRALDDFDRDYDTFSILETSRPREVGRPFLIRGDRRRVGVVLAHGYMAAPAEVRGLAEHLGKMGFWVYAPRLKGHGTAPEDLAECTFQDWIDSMDAGYAVLKNLCRRVIAGGFSTGAGLALDLAQRVPAVAGVFAVSAPLRLQDVAARFVPAVDVWNQFMERFHLDDAKKTFVDNHPENPDINYFKNPISGVRELERLMSSLEPRLPQITSQALVIQSREDPVVDSKGTEKIFKLLGSTDKQMVLFNFQRHGILLGEGANRVYRAIGDFLDHIRKSP
ncbi:MAG: alpha/beta fold hydrolase [Desulfosarcina sp.]|nr:alpha/beta fold hydrolase [Desulfosarcina sp.]